LPNNISVKFEHFCKANLPIAPSVISNIDDETDGQKAFALAKQQAIKALNL